eukprot:TRINITY_DN3077_c0_g3_i2.p1 TRINITY_DN3077_c0_g3~~TRINITY_DN3077_c0_g3_i2.p1  ORF type:complete len:281 (+),score=101.16 TRINITY_DN3077_c0_g3_i2:69-911(+)
MCIRDRIKTTHALAVAEKNAAEDQKNELEKRDVEKDAMINELDYQITLLRFTGFGHVEEIERLNRNLSEQQVRINDLENENLMYKEDIKQKNEEIDGLRKELEDMKAVVAKLGDVRHVLNRLMNEPEYIGGKKALNQSVDAKLIKAFNEPQDEGQELSGDSKFMQGNANTKLKPLAKKPDFMVNEDDFWYGAVGNYGKDFGGKNHNEAWQYQNVAGGKLQNSERESQSLKKKASAKNALPPLPGQKEQIIWNENESFEDYAKKNLPIKLDKSPAKNVRGK